MKTMKFRLAKMGVALALIMGGLTVAVAAGKDGTPTDPPAANKAPLMEMPDEMGPMPMMDNLTDKQREQIKTIHTQTKAAILPIRANLQEREARLNTLMIADKADMSQIQASVTEISDLKGKIMLERVKSQQEIRKVLTPEQRTQFDAMLLQKGHGHGRGMGGMRGHHGGGGQHGNHGGGGHHGKGHSGCKAPTDPAPKGDQ